jgi:hypothetical protein
VKRLQGVQLQEASMNLKLAIGLLIVSTAALPRIPVAALAQDGNTDTSIYTATGCLRDGATSRDFLLTDDDGKTWYLRSDNVRLRPHVGHTVTVAGQIPAGSKNSNDTEPQNHLVVTKVDEIRDSCKQN